MPYPTITEAPGSLSATGLAVETSFGVPVAASTFLPATGNSMSSDPGWFSPGLMMNVRDKQVFDLYGEQKNTGSLEGPLFPSNAIPLLVAAIGTDAVTGSGPYLHTLSQANVLPSLTVEQNIGGRQSLQYAGCKVGKLSIKAPTGNEPVSMTAEMSGQSVLVLDTPTAVSVTNELPFVFAEASVTLMSHARAEVTNVTIDIDNDLKETYTFGNHGPAFVTPVTLHCSGQIDVVWSSLDSSTYGDFTTMATGATGALAVSFTHPGGGGYSVGFTFPQVTLSKVVPDVKYDAVVMSTLSWEATRSLASGYTVQAAVSNGVSGAYAG